MHADIFAGGKGSANSTEKQTTAGHDQPSSPRYPADEKHRLEKHMKAKSVSKSVAKPVSDSDGDDYQAQSDADTLTRAQEIQNDSDRHQKATDHLQTKAQSSGDAHAANRKLLEKKTKKRLNKVFGGKGKNFGAEKDSEKGDTQKIVNEDD